MIIKVMWTLKEIRSLTSNSPYESIIHEVADLLVRVEVAAKPTWVYAGRIYVSDVSDTIPTGLIARGLQLGVRELIRVGNIIQYLPSSVMKVSYYPKKWIAEYGYSIGIWQWT
ncbi:MAG: hypothetical protein F6K40_23970 [Okeania sp. SIO3I5]|uniref:hypothetical protein n=1 Tax=Okeania sp. SIO3I5 TaxID=2607805 RepID=UPI0013BC91D8|nr:hypothetical protein [Okeania sp. SIO3I5]NEQ39143.1 hypothetical protein [Okeania sp. SIO3I5]